MPLHLRANPNHNLPIVAAGSSPTDRCYFNGLRHSLGSSVAFASTFTPAGRWGDPAELIGAAVFFASSASNFVSGQILYVDGGLMAAI